MLGGRVQSAITICIPTRNRVDLLEIAVRSCFSQDYRPLEILIGDDSDGPETALWVKGLQAPEGVTIGYEWNRQPLGQSGNVNRLFDRATSRVTMLLHDDDFLCPHGLDILAKTMARAPDALCVYGVQWIVDAAGADMKEATDAWSARYFRLPEYRGPQKSALVAALWQQVPNDCYLMDTALARRIRCKPENEIGHCVDADFVIRASLDAPADSFIFVNQLVSKYRLTSSSIARSNDLNRRQDLLFDSIDILHRGNDVEAAKDIILSRIAVGASLDAAMAGRSLTALHIILSRYYNLPLMSRWTIYRIVCSVSPWLGSWIKRFIDRFMHHEIISDADRILGYPHRRLTH